jgi:hypothetical protein
MRSQHRLDSLTKLLIPGTSFVQIRAALCGDTFED